MIKVLVTGAKGQLGRTLKDQANRYPSMEFRFLDAKGLDITNKDDVFAALKDFKPDYCINTAAYTNVEKAEEEPEKAFKVNTEGVKFLAEACKENNTILIHISTDYVFDGTKNTPYRTDDATNPVNVYGASKLEGEKAIRKLLQKYFIVRTSWLYSKNYGHNFYRAILNKALSGSDLVVTDEQVGCPTNAQNLSAFLLQLISDRNEHYGIMHFCDKKVMTWFDFAQDILKEHHLQDQVSLKKGTYVTIAKRPRYSVLRV